MIGWTLGFREPGYFALVSQTLDPAIGSDDDGTDDDGADVGGRIRVRGVVDAAAGCRLGAVLAERLALGSSQIDVDLSAVESIDAQGLVAIVRSWHEIASSGRTLRLLDPSPAIGPLLALSGLTTEFTDR